VAESTETLSAGQADAPEEHLSEYTTQTGDNAQPKAAVRKPVVTGKALGTGRRKDRALDVYFPNKVHQQLVSEPFVTLGAEDQFDVVARIDGGGVSGQAGALRLGIARALTLVDPDSRSTLKRAGFLTRDARVTERKKAGLKKARKAPQYSKR
jgi:small subunit ribosomal protein S9